MDSRRHAVVYAALVILLLVPLWAFRFIPTQDGPSHLYNALILKDYGAEGTRYAEFFEIRKEPVPNWMSHLLLAALMYLVSPLVAEKCLLTLYVAGFAWSYRYFVASVHPSALALAPVGLLFLYNRNLLMGFYNYSLSLIVFWIVADYCLRRRGVFGTADVAFLAPMLLLGYFCHLVGFLLAAATAIWIALTARRPSWKGILCAGIWTLPAGLLAMWFLTRVGLFDHAKPTGLITIVTDYWGQHAGWRELWQDAIRINTELFAAYEQAWLPLGAFVFLLYEFLIVCSAATPVEPDAKRPQFPRLPVVALALGILVLYFALPDFIGPHGGFMRARLALLPPLLLLPCLRLPTHRWLRRSLSAAIYSLLAVKLFLVLSFFSRTNQELTAFTQSLMHTGTNRTFLAFTPAVTSQPVDHLLHAPEYCCLTGGNVNLDNYEAYTDYFPVRFRRDLRPRSRSPHAYFELFPVDMIILWDRTVDDAGLQLADSFHTAYRDDRMTILVAQRSSAKANSTTPRSDP